MKRAYCALSTSGSSWGVGWQHNTIVLVFNSESQRDDFVVENKPYNKSVRPILRREIRNVLNGSYGHCCWITETGSFWGVWIFQKNMPAGCIGKIERLTKIDISSPLFVSKFK